MKRVVRIEREGETPELGLWRADDQVIVLPRVFAVEFAELIGISRAEGKPIAQLLDDLLAKEGASLTTIAYQDIDGQHVRLLTPVAAPEVWACGVTYERSRAARNEEAQGFGMIYDKVYDADRPEIFLKATPGRVAPPYEAVGIRGDSAWMVPEPELALVLTRTGEIAGYTIGNDMSSRDIEGENPLYLPQAKMFARCASYGPSVLIDDGSLHPYDMDITCRIWRDKQLMFDGRANTSQLKRKFEELIAYLTRHNPIMDGTVLMTGTCLVPEDDFTLIAGDRIEIEIGDIGCLVNPVQLLS